MLSGIVLKRWVLIVPVLVVAGMLSGCVLATVRTLDEDAEAKVGFSGAEYVETIWDSEVLPTYREQAQDLSTLLALLAENKQSAIDQYGHRSGTGPYSFMVRGEGKILTFDTTSRAGLVTIDLNPPDGTADLTLTVGPLIKISQRAAVRDAVGIIAYGNFVNQQEFADVANAMGDKITLMLAGNLGAPTVDAIRDLDPTSIEGKTVSFIGAYSLENPDVLVIPVVLEVTD